MSKDHHSGSNKSDYNNSNNNILPKSTDHCKIFFEGINKYTYKKKISTKEVLLKKGEICNKVYIILKGAVKQYSYDKYNNEELNKFYRKSSIASNMDSFLNQTISETTLEAVAGSLLQVLDRRDYQQLMKDSPEMKNKFTECIIYHDRKRKNDSDYLLLMALYKKLRV